MPFVLTEDDCEIYYETSGHGPAVAFAPGFMGITDIWRSQMEALSSRYRCIAFDNRGAGRSDKPVPRIRYGVERHAADLALVLDHAGVERTVLIGHSMGGNTACRFHGSHPQRVAGIVFIGSYVSGAQIAGIGNTIDRIRDAVTMKAQRIAFYRSVGLPEDIAMEAAKWPLYAVLGNAESFMAFDGAAQLPHIRVPCLIIHGSNDIVSPYEPCGTELAALLPDVEVELLDGVNHCPMTERPEATNERLLRFLEQRIEW